MPPLRSASPAVPSLVSCTDRPPYRSALSLGSFPGPGPAAPSHGRLPPPSSYTGAASSTGAVPIIPRYPSRLE